MIPGSERTALPGCCKADHCGGNVTNAKASSRLGAMSFLGNPKLSKLSAQQVDQGFAWINHGVILQVLAAGTIVHFFSHHLPETAKGRCQSGAVANLSGSRGKYRQRQNRRDQAAGQPNQQAAFVLHFCAVPQMPPSAQTVTNAWKRLACALPDAATYCKKCAKHHRMQCWPLGSTWMRNLRMNSDVAKVTVVWRPAPFTR